MLHPCTPRGGGRGQRADPVSWRRNGWTGTSGHGAGKITRAPRRRRRCTRLAAALHQGGHTTCHACWRPARPIPTSTTRTHVPHVGGEGAAPLLHGGARVAAAQELLGDLAPTLEQRFNDECAAGRADGGGYAAAMTQRDRLQALEGGCR